MAGGARGMISGRGGDGHFGSDTLTICEKIFSISALPDRSLVADIVEHGACWQIPSICQLKFDWAYPRMEVVRWCSRR